MAVTHREVLKKVAKEIRQYLKETGGTFSVRVQTNDVIWISGAYAFGVDYEVRPMMEVQFNHWLRELAFREGLEFNSGPIHRFLK